MGGGELEVVKGWGVGELLKFEKAAVQTNIFKEFFGYKLQEIKNLEFWNS